MGCVQKTRMVRCTPHRPRRIHTFEEININIEY
nr:MAG TPA: hypothetical protein [Bacteriophage sp.]